MEFKPGKVVRHVLGFDVCMIKETSHIRGSGIKTKTVNMIKCRFVDKNGMLHVHEFNAFELESK